MENFLTLHTPYASQLLLDRNPSEEEITLALTRRGRPVWNHEDWLKLLDTLANAGYGWLRPEGVGRELEKMAKKGLVFRKNKDDGVYYAAAPFVIGTYEYQIGRIDKEFAQRVEGYFNEVFLRNMTENIPPLRTIPVSQSIDISHNVAIKRS